MWTALGGDVAATESAALPSAGPFLGSLLPVGEFATATVTAALLAAAELAETRGGHRPVLSADARHVATAFRSERHLLVDGAAGESFAPLSAFFGTADGWVRLHANYPHHRVAVLRVLGLSADDAQQVANAVRGWHAVDLEGAVAEAGGVAAAVRTEQAWRSSPQGAAVDGLPLVHRDVVDAPGARALPPGELPASGVRVLDLTRVIAGPVGTRMLAALGADVLRVDSPHLSELPRQALDGGPGKRSALLDLTDSGDRGRFEQLLADADVLVQGYRPGALAAFELDQAAVAERHPHLVTVTLSAWGQVGPWADRRGFDSLVQAATGIATRCGDGGRPGVLPAQALDHGTGYLVAAAALRALAVRQREGRVTHARLALARTAHWLLDRPLASEVTEVTETAVDPDEFRVEFAAPGGRVSMISPPGSLDGRPLRWSHGPSPWGADRATWR